MTNEAPKLTAFAAPRGGAQRPSGGRAGAAGSASVRVLAGAGDAARWLAQRLGGCGTLRTDSRAVQAGDAFIAWPGYARDGRSFVKHALDAGALACLVELEGLSCFSSDSPQAALPPPPVGDEQSGRAPFAHDALGCAPDDERLAALPGLKAATGVLADAFYGHPSALLDVVATTGTNGKTSTAWWLAQALSHAGRRCGVIGTLGVGEPPTPQRPQAQVRHTGLTTPDPVTLHASLRAFVDQGFAAAAIEASSIGIVEHRLAGARIQVALYTNFTADHLDYHGNMAEYWAAKRLLFAWPGLRAAVLNLDDAQGAALADELQRGGSLELWTYSATRTARLMARDVRYVGDGLAFMVVEAFAQGPVQAPVQTALIGEYNVANVLAVIGGLRALGLPLDQCASLAGHFTPVPGRMQRVASTVGEPQIVVDYAHTPDALEKALQALRSFAQARGGRLWCVFGCGGNRDSAKRPVMGAIAARLADQVVITSDNPRNEDPAVIVSQIVGGTDDAAHVACEIDRRAAIAHAVVEAAPQDVLLLAGKGHEDYQDVAGVKLPFSDLEEAARALAARHNMRHDMGQKGRPS